MSLRTIPREIRLQIYDLALDWDIVCACVQEPRTVIINGSERLQGAVYKARKRRPSLIIALRGDQDLYKEALAVFYRMHTFELWRFTLDGLFRDALLSCQNDHEVELCIFVSCSRMF